MYKPQYTTEKYTATVNIKYTDNDIKYDETQKHGRVIK